MDARATGAVHELLRTVTLLAPWGGYAEGEQIDVDPARLKMLVKAKLVEAPAKARKAAVL